MNSSKRALGIILSIGISLPLLLRAIETYTLVFVKVGNVFVFVIHYFLYLASLASISLIFWQFIFQPFQKDTQPMWSLLPSIIIPWVIFWDFALPSTMLVTLTLLKAIFYLIVLIRFTHHILEASTWITLDRNIYVALLSLVIINFAGDNLIGSNLYIGYFDSPASVFTSKVSMSFFATILMIYAVFYTNSFIQKKADETKITPYISIMLASLSLFFSTMVLYQGTYSIFSSWGFMIKITLPNPPFTISHFALFLYLLVFAYIRTSKIKYIDVILSVSFLVLFIGMNASDVVSAGYQAVEFVQEDLGRAATVFSSAVAIIGTAYTIIGWLRRPPENSNKKENL
jgi:hypothetical protein